jgi:uncharacterized protein (DUF1684 family)
VVANRDWTEYREKVEAWRADMETQLRAENGWLTVVGLFWLRRGENTVGSAPDCDIILPTSQPKQVGSLDFDGTRVVLRVITRASVLVDGVPTIAAPLRDDHQDAGATIVSMGSVSFYVLQRGDQYAVRVKDSNASVRQTFAGRRWFPVDEHYHVRATFHPHSSDHLTELDTSAGTITTLTSPGIVEFDLRGKLFRLEAFAAKHGQVWLIFRDKTSGVSTYGAGRFLYADVSETGSVDLDFNKAYHPPCAFTHFATCPLPPKQNTLPIAIAAGEKLP